jgi:hypothetical protein
MNNQKFLESLFKTRLTKEQKELTLKRFVYMKEFGRTREQMTSSKEPFMETFFKKERKKIMKLNKVITKTLRNNIYTDDIPSRKDFKNMFNVGMLINLIINKRKKHLSSGKYIVEPSKLLIVKRIDEIKRYFSSNKKTPKQNSSYTIETQFHYEVVFFCGFHKFNKEDKYKFTCRFNNEEMILYFPILNNTNCFKFLCNIEDVVVL